MIITENFKFISATAHPYRGLIKCRVLAPKGLLHPLLPVRSAGKLCFPLCKTCVHSRQTEPCEHSEEERSFSGAWCTIELYKALELGYKVLDISEVILKLFNFLFFKKIFQVWHYEQWSKYEGEDPESGLFTEYINTFLKIKQEASGWPEWVETEEDKQRYVCDYHAKEGILLDPLKIEKNGALRQLAKLCLNRFVILC